MTRNRDIPSSVLIQTCFPLSCVATVCIIRLAKIDVSLSKRINKRVELSLYAYILPVHRFTPATHTPRECTRLPLVGYRLRCRLNSGRSNERELHILRFYALAARWTVHANIDCSVIFTYFKIFAFMEALCVYRDS